MAKQPKSSRVDPLDRDGDGERGGSLKGNQTAPYAEDATPPWARDDDYILDALRLVGEGWEFDADRLTLDVVKSWPDGQAREAEAWAEACVDTATGTEPDAPEFLHAFRAPAPETPPEAPPAEAVQEPDPAAPPAEDAQDQTGDQTDKASEDAVASRRRPPSDDHAHAPAADEPDPADTFTREEIEAGRTGVIQEEGEIVTTAAEAERAVIALDGDLIQLAASDNTVPPIAVRLSELRLLTEATRLYRSAEGYSATYGAPYIAEATISGWIAHRLAEAIPSAGNTGGVRATDYARQVLRDAPRSAAA